MKTRRQFIQGVGGGLAGWLLTRALPVGVGALLWPRRLMAATVLDPNNPGNFTRDGNQTLTPGAVLTLTDSSIGDFVVLYAQDSDAAAAVDVDVVATFQVRATGPNNADAGNRVAINDGVTRAAVAACVIVNSVKGIGLLSQGPAADPASYPVFVPADWQAALVTIRLRRTAAGDAELVEVNGVAPSPRALLSAAKLAGPTRAAATVEFGCASQEATCTVEYSAFRSEPVANPVAGQLSFTSFRLQDSVDRVRFRADYALGGGSNGINPAVEPVTIKLSTPGGGQFYPAPDFNPLNGFSVQGTAPKRRWTLGDAERARTGIEQLVIDEGANNTGAVSLRDFHATLPNADFSTVPVEITIGTGAAADQLAGTAHLVEKPAGSGRWTL